MTSIISIEPQIFDRSQRTIETFSGAFKADNRISIENENVTKLRAQAFDMKSF